MSVLTFEINEVDGLFILTSQLFHGYPIVEEFEDFEGLKARMVEEVETYLK